VDGGDHRYGQLVDAVEQLQRLRHHVLDLVFGVETFELTNVGAGDEARLLAAHQHQAFDLAGGRFLDGLDDLAKLLRGPAAQRVHALALAVDDRPGDALEVDRDGPVLKIGKRDWHIRVLLGGDVLVFRV